MCEQDNKAQLNCTKRCPFNINNTYKHFKNSYKSINLTVQLNEDKMSKLTISLGRRITAPHINNAFSEKVSSNIIVITLFV